MFVMQTSAMKTCFQIAECSFSYAKLSNISVTSKYLNEINIIIGKRQGSICHDEKVAYRPFIVRCSFIVNIRYIDYNGSYCFKIS